MTDTQRRRVTGDISLSLDGRTSGPGGEVDMGFILPHTRSDGTRAGTLRLTEATTAVMGQKAYEGFAGYWPIVARDASADPRDREFAQWLDRVDRLCVNLLPELVGDGARLFEDGLPASTWTLAEAYPDDTGAIWLYYDRVREPADETGRFTLRRTLNTSLTEAWDAWQDEATLRKWWGPTGFTCPRADVDLRVGGSALVTMQAPAEFGGFQMHNRWRYTVVDKPTTIEFVSTFTDDSGDDVPAPQLGLPAGVPDEVPHRVSFAAAGEDRTEITVTEWGYTTATARAQSQAGQEQVLDKLQALFATTSAD